jgi:hypothetical protein
MATKHSAIINQILIDWTHEGRGTLWTNPQIRIPAGNGKHWLRAGLGVGTADIVGIADTLDDGTWVSIETKTRGDWLKKEQKHHLETVTDWGGIYYLALEMPGCTVESPEYELYQVHSIDDLPRIRREWNKLFKESEQ